MARRHPGLPRAQPFSLSKKSILAMLKQIDKNSEIRERILHIENKLSEKIAYHIKFLLVNSARLKDFNTSPYVVMIHAKKRGCSKIKELEKDILPAKEFSSMETSAGRMIEEVLLPVYGWETVSSGMHTAYSSIDGKKLDDDTLHLATLKSGPRCLNDEMSENFADSIIQNCVTWAKDSNVRNIDFTYGVLYGTQKQSNKKDWHILRSIRDKLPASCLIAAPDNKWCCSFIKEDISVRVTIRIGPQWWEYIGGASCLLELALAMIRSCIVGDSNQQCEKPSYMIGDMENIVSINEIDSDYNVSILQKSQLPWLFFFLYHFCDDLND